MSLAMTAVRYNPRAGSMGDPGLGGLLKKGLRLATRAGSFIPGPIGMAAKAANVLLAGAGAVSVAKTVKGAIVGSPPLAQQIPMPDLGVGPFGVHLPGAAPGVGLQVGSTTFGAFPAQSLNGGHRAMRPNKTSYFLRDGTFVEAGTKMVRVRRRNPLNPRALDRAMGRLVSAKKAASKMGRISIRTKKCC